MVEKHGVGKMYESRLSIGPIESINHKMKDFKRSGRGYRNFEHFRNRFLYSARQAPVLNGVTDYIPVLYLEADALCHGNWIEIQRPYRRIDILVTPLRDASINVPGAEY